MVVADEDQPTHDLKNLSMNKPKKESNIWLT
jgi:hypothetical protein